MTKFRPANHVGVPKLAYTRLLRAKADEIVANPDSSSWEISRALDYRDDARIIDEAMGATTKDVWLKAGAEASLREAGVGVMEIVSGASLSGVVGLGLLATTAGLPLAAAGIGAGIGLGLCAATSFASKKLKESAAPFLEQCRAVSRTRNDANETFYYGQQDLVDRALRS